MLCIHASSVDHSTNLIILRADINAGVFNESYFVIIPLAGRACSYFIKHGYSGQHVQSFHCRYAKLPLRIPPALVFYRFTWAMTTKAGSELTSYVQATFVQVPIPDELKIMIQQAMQRKTPTGSAADSDSASVAIAPDENQRVMYTDPEKYAEEYDRYDKQLTSILDPELSKFGRITLLCPHAKPPR